MLRQLNATLNATEPFYYLRKSLMSPPQRKYPCRIALIRKGEEGWLCEG
jgi:hypothetical protein